MSDRRSRSIKLTDFLSEKEIKRAIKIRKDYKANGMISLAGKLRQEIIEPAMDRINKTTGQENDAMYWAYALEYSLMGMKL